MNQYTFKASQWIRLALLNFCIVALAGITMRYKINFPLPFINQKNLLHAHSHFAFTGWLALVLMALMVNYLQQQNTITNYKKYHWTLLANCLAGYGMLFAFIAQGYAFYSISFSTLSIFIGYFFVYHFWRDLNKIQDKSYAPIWFKAALILWTVSSLGAFTLAYLMANHITVQDYYFGAIYFFLHFQYNGWFLFVCLGLLSSYLFRKGLLSTIAINKKLFLVMAITVGPTYLLSVLWLKLPKFLHIMADISGILQLLVLFFFIKLLLLLKKQMKPSTSSITRNLLVLSAIAFILKIILQMLSIIPLLSSYAFGFRPIVIGYLHLSFLGVISFFILGYSNTILNQTNHRFSKGGVSVFVIGVLAQELVLMCQGLEVMQFKPLPYANLVLFFTAIIMGIGLIWILISTFNKR